MRLPPNWESLRRAALERAGYRSERNGKCGRLEVHHINGDRADNRPENLMCLTRDEHILEHHKPDPDRVAWRNYLELMP